MPAVVRAFAVDDASDVASLWQRAVDEQRRRSGRPEIDSPNDVLHRPGVFGVGLFEADRLMSMAVGMPALEDDGRSARPVPGLAHISSVATAPDAWGRGYARRALVSLIGQAARRGYARAQLWVLADNAAARHLYEALGLRACARERVDDNGDRLAFYHGDIPSLPVISRPAARLVCLDPEDRILLMHFRDPFDGFQLWEPPGGGIESGETPRVTVIREWLEETGLPVPELIADSTTVARDMVFNGTRSVVDEDFFLGRSDSAGEPVTAGATPIEQETYLGHSWVHWSELDSLSDPVTPDLLPVLVRLDPAGPWAGAAASGTDDEASGSR